MLIETDGLVIKETNVGETDRLITVLTSEYGLIRAFVTGGKSMKNKNLAGTGLLTYSDFVFYKGRDSYNVNSASEKEVFFELRNNIDNLSIAFYLAELFGELAPETAECSELLKLLLNSVYLLSKDKISGVQVKAVAELRAVAISGYAPNHVACTECGAFESEPMYFDIKHGTLRCDVCKEGGRKLSFSTVTAMRHIIYSEAKKVFDFKLSDACLLELSAVCEAFALQQTGCIFKTLDFLKSLSNI